MSDMSMTDPPATLQLRVLHAANGAPTLQLQPRPDSEWIEAPSTITFDPDGARSARLHVLVEPAADPATDDWTLAVHHEGHAVVGETSPTTFVGPETLLVDFAGAYELSLHTASGHHPFTFHVELSSALAGIDFTDNDTQPPPRPTRH